MYNFYRILKRYSRSISKNLDYSEKDAQSLYNMIIKYFKDYPESSNSEAYEYFSELFSNVNLEVASLPTIKNDTLRYNICKYLNKHPEELKKIHEKINEEEKSNKIEFKPMATYSSNRQSAMKRLVLEARNALIEEKEEYREEYREQLETFFKSPRRIQNEYKKGMSSEKRRVFEHLEELFSGDEVLQIEKFLKKVEPNLKEELKKEYIESITFLGSKFEEFELLDTYYFSQRKSLNLLGFERLEYPLSSKAKDTLSIKEAFNEENLKKMSLNQLSMINTFWINRFTKELSSMNKTFFIVNSLGMWNYLRNAKKDVSIEEKELRILYKKMNFLHGVSAEIFKDLEESDSIIETSDKNGRSVRKFDSEPIRNRICNEIGGEYRKYFTEIQPELTHNLSIDLSDFMVMENSILNSYNLKDTNMISILSNLYEDDFSKNWGIIIEKDKQIESSRMVLLGIDVAGLNMPVRLHIDKRLVQEFLKSNQNTSLIPVYEGADDFCIDQKNINTHVLMPLCERQRKGFEELRKNEKNSNSKKKLLEHFAFLAQDTVYPEHLKIEKIVKKNGKSKIVKKRPDKRYLDLNTGEQFHINKDGIQTRCKNGEERI